MGTPNEPGAPDGDARSTLDELQQVLERIPGAAVILRDVRELRALLVDRRPPRVAAIGRRGSGKSSLANALLGADVLQTGAVEDTTRTPQWIAVDHQGRRLRWLDTPGLRAGEAPHRRDDVRRALTREPPDVILVACRATQVDAGIDEDIAEVLWLLEHQKKAGLVPPAVVAVVTRCDELSPLGEKGPPFAEEKRANIDRAVEQLRVHCERLKLPVTRVLGVAAYQRFLSDGMHVVDWRWNVDALADAIFVALPMEARSDAARAFEASRTLRRRVARRMVSAAAGIAFVIGATPLPVADMALLVPLQVAMITGVMYVGGVTGTKRTAAEWIAGLGVNVGAGFVLREAVRALARLIGPGNMISGAMAAGGTWAMGVSAIKYFIDGGTMEEARAAFEHARRDGAPREVSEDRASTDTDDAASRADVVTPHRDD